jgi:hypothetical protein
VRLSPASRRQIGLILFAAAVLGALLGLATFWRHLTEDPLGDVRAYYDAAVRLNNGQPLYPSGADTNAAEFYRYPPLLAVMLRPFALLPYATFAVLWEAVVVATFVLTLYRVGVRRTETWLAVGMLGVPIAWAVTIGQAHVPMTWLISLGTPLGIALAAQIKLFPALIALYWLGRREWPALARFVAFSLGLVALQVVLEPRGLVAFLGVTNLQQVGQVRNLSPYESSSALWAVLVVAGAFATLVLARTRWGWAMAVTLSTLASPRLLTYMLMTLITALRPPAGRGATLPSAIPEAQVGVSHHPGTREVPPSSSHAR